MTPLLGVLEFGDYAIIAWIVVVFAGGAAYTARQRIDLGRLEQQLDRLHQKMDALLKHQGVALHRHRLPAYLQRLSDWPATQARRFRPSSFTATRIPESALPRRRLRLRHFLRADSEAHAIQQNLLSEPPPNFFACYAACSIPRRLPAVSPPRRPPQPAPGRSRWPSSVMAKTSSAAVA
jgi:hypothetical protein